MATLEVWIEYASTYSWLTVARIGRLARSRGVRLDWQPSWLPPVRERQGLPPPFPVDSLRTARAALLGAREGWCQPFTEEAFRLHWTEGCPVGTEQNLARALAHAGQDPARVTGWTGSPEAEEALRDQTARALERGIFGAPSFVVAGGIFWGDDRLEQALVRATAR